jgi:nicotinamidase/pyrazinamidase
MIEDAVLIVVDVQNGFMPGGGLPVPLGDEVVPVVNALAAKFAHVVLTQDWHPRGHASFASSHAGKNAFDVIDMPYGNQVLWPEHCVQGTRDAEIHADMRIPHAQLIIRKGFHAQVDSYSAFMEADRTTTTGLAAYLKAHGFKKVYVCGLATDFCVAWTALDARAEGFEVSLVEDACRAIDLNGSLVAAWESMQKAGVERVQSVQVSAQLSA